MKRDVAGRLIDAIYEFSNRTGRSPIEIHLSRDDWSLLVDYMNNTLFLGYPVEREWKPGAKFAGLHVLIGDSEEIVIE